MSTDTSNENNDLVGGDSSATSVDIIDDEQQQHHQSPHSTPSNSASGLLFFADATLDLSEAHDIAETPEPCRMVLGEAPLRPAAGGLIQMPILEHSSEATASDTPKNTATPSLENNNDITMNRITNQDFGNIPLFPAHPPKRPRRPRDIPWAVSLLLFCPTTLLITSLFQKDYDGKFTRGAQGSVFYCILASYAAAVVLGRLLYRTSGDGQEARHVATQVLYVSCPLSVAIYFCLFLLVIIKTPHARIYAILPLVYSIKNALALRRIQTQRVFFQEVVKMSLEMLQKSLKRNALYRILSTLLGIQCFFVVVWKLSLFGSISHQSIFWIVASLVCGKWFTSTIARILSFTSSGGIVYWFMQQSQFFQETQQQQDTTNLRQEEEEEYETADANAYQSVLTMEDEDDDEEEFIVDDDGAQPSVYDWSNTSGTAKSLLIGAVTTSLGSVAQCALLGGLAQWTWSLLRTTDVLLVSHRGFARMQIGSEGRVSVSILLKLTTQASVMARVFVKRHADLAMSHVVAYYKSYTRAASDVMMLVDASGVEPIIQDDITTHVCSCVCGSISGLVVIVVGTILSHRRGGNLTDQALVQSMLLAFILCYALLFTVMEPLRASIKAIYVCFAQHPQSLSQAYPLIFHRLSRISEANLS